MIVASVIKSMETINMTQSKQIRERFLARFLADSRQHLLHCATTIDIPCVGNVRASCPGDSSSRLGKTED
jgi:hypothetical protein